MLTGICAKSMILLNILPIVNKNSTTYIYRCESDLCSYEGQAQNKIGGFNWNFSGLCLQLFKLLHNCKDHFHFCSLSAEFICMIYIILYACHIVLNVL